MNTVSVVIASYNPVWEWLQETLSSCIGVDELLIGDDGSTPPIDMALYEIPQVDRFEVHRRSVNAGCFNTVNRIVKESRCDFISAQADDDTFEADAFQKILKVVRESQADVVHFPCMYYGKIQGPFGANPQPTFNATYCGNNIYGASFFRKSMWEFLGGFKDIVGGDWDFWLRALKSGFTFQYVPQFGARFRVSERSWFEKELQEKGRVRINAGVRASVDAWDKVYAPAKAKIGV